MNKSELIKALALKTNVTKAVAGKSIDALARAQGQVLHSNNSSTGSGLAFQQFVL